MTKLLVGALALAGALCLLNFYAPQTWTTGITIKGYLIPYACMILGGVGYLALWAKSKG